MLRRICVMSDGLLRGNGTEQRSLLDDFIVMKTFADVTCHMVHWIVFNPTTALIVAAVLYLIFVIIFTPFLLFSYAISSFGSFLLFLLMLCLAARALSRTMTFPGSTLGYQRGIAADFLRRICDQLNHISFASSDLMSMMLLRLNGQQFCTHSGLSVEQRYAGLLKQSSMLPHLSNWLSDGKPSIIEGMLPDEQGLFGAFMSSIDELGFSQDTISEIFNSANSRFPFQDILNDEQRSADMSVTVRKALQSSENLKAVLIKVLPKADETNEEGGYADTAKMAIKQVTEFLSIPKGPSGLERISYPIMREQLKFRYGTSRYSVLGEDGNVIDAVWIPCVHPKGGPGGTATNRSGDALPTTDPSTRHPNSVSSSTAVGTVLFCCPNAGLYECVSQSNPQASWLGYYHAQSFDVCMFNYRGYNESTGIPTPARLKSDGVSMVNYLYDELHIHGGLIVHGESVGGMVACHIARHYTKHTPPPSASHMPVSHHTKENPIVMLVCDRTFASLDAVAARMLGSWTSYALRYIGHWDTRVVDDYLHTYCPKVILQDPRDEIIAHDASLKSCIATRLLLQDKVHLNTTLSRCYGIHDYVSTYPASNNQQGPSRSENGNRDDDTSLCSALPPFLEDALFQDVDYSVLPPAPPVSGGTHSQANNVSPVSEQWIQHFTACIISIGRRTLVYPSAGGGHGGGARRSSQQPPRTSHGNNSTSNPIQQGPPSPSHSDDYSSVGSSHSRSSSGDRMLDLESTLEGGQEDEEQKRILMRKVWNLVIKMDDGCGQLLGQCLAIKLIAKGLAAGASLNSVRTWICNCIVWNQPLEGDTSIQCMTTDNVLKWKRNLDSTYYPAGCRYHVLEVIHQLKMLLPSTASGCSEECSFVLNALEHIVELNKQCTSIQTQGGDRFVNSSGDDGEEGLISRTTAECNWISSNYDPSYCSNRSNSSGYPISSLLGQVIPVHAGHNGWPSAEELNLFTSVLKYTAIDGNSVEGVV